MPEFEGYPNPYLRSGPNKGKIKNPLVAHEVFNTIQQLKENQKSDKSKPFFRKYGNDEALILQAAKTVREEEKNTFDYLTKLHQKKSFEIFINDDLAKLKAGELKTLGILRFDLDNFSWLNDNLEAHMIGDLYLAQVGRIIRDSIKGNKDVGIRIGGDEFAVLLRDPIDGEAFKSVALRLHKSLNQHALFSTLQLIQASDRSVTNEKGQEEKEGTMILKQFLTGFKNLRNNEDGRADHFMHSGRGNRKRIKDFLQMLREIDVTHYDIYLNDERTWAQLDDRDRHLRRIQESEVIELIDKTFVSLGVSTGGIFVDRNHLQSFRQYNDRTDELVYAVKRRGGRSYNLEYGIGGTKI
ncbi:MAG: diguanylate cyclase [Patescibacteria group bacterium]|nr:diguanylate cyclase [Patescibacteria group bacterium]